jgi:glutaredoxin 3
MHNVKIYSTSTCPYCAMAKEFLKKNDIQFENVDVGMDRQAAKEMRDKSGQMGVPVLDIDGQIIVGFDKDAISSALGLL